MPQTYSGTCKKCGKDYQGRSPNFCSRNCYAQSKWVDRECEFCKGKFRAIHYYVIHGRMRYCSPQCAQLALRKNDPIEFNGDVYYLKRDGYYKSIKTGNLLHREIWKSHHGEIPPGYIIHHKDENKINNEIDNLLLVSWGGHTSLHNKNKPKPRHKERSVCSIDGCERLSIARTLCAMHYQRVRAKEIGKWA